MVFVSMVKHLLNTREVVFFNMAFCFDRKVSLMIYEEIIVNRMMESIGEYVR